MKVVSNKSISLLFCLILSIVGVYGQHIKIDNAISYSSMKGGPYDLLSLTKSGYGVTLGMDYLERKYFYLSSNIGYLQTGGKDELSDPYTGAFDRYLSLTAHNIHLNTTFRGRLPIANLSLYAGAGVKVDCLIDYDYSEKELEYKDTPLDFNKESFMLGPMFEAGICYDISRLRLGIGYDYFFNLNDSNNFRGRTSRISFSIGYAI